MKLIKLFFLLFIINIGLQSWTKADDISEFEIEGISIGDSALKYFSKKTFHISILIIIESSVEQ